MDSTIIAETTRHCFLAFHIIDRNLNLKDPRLGSDSDIINKNFCQLRTSQDINPEWIYNIGIRHSLPTLNYILLKAAEALSSSRHRRGTCQHF